MFLEIEQHRELILMNICSSFEIFIASLIRFELMNIYQNGAYIGSQDISFNEIEKLGSIMNVKEKMVNDFIMSSQYEKLEKWLVDFISICTPIKAKTKRGKLNFSKEMLDQIDILSVAFQKRNLCVHNNGVVNDVYVRNVNDELNVGDKINIDHNDLISLINTTLDLCTEIFLLNLKKNKYLEDLNYSTDLTTYLTTHVEDSPDVCQKFFIKMLRGDFNIIDKQLSKMQQAVVCVDVVNTWLTYDLLDKKDEFLEDFKTDYLKIQKLIPSEPSLKFLDGLIRNETKDKMFILFDDFMKTYSSKAEKINALDFPIFHSLRNEEKFIEYAKNIRYNQ